MGGYQKGNLRQVREGVFRDGIQSLRLRRGLEWRVNGGGRHPKYRHEYE